MSLSQRRYADALKTIKSLEKAGFAARLAGGCVRDRLLGIAPADYDVATTATPEAMLLHFRTEKLNAIPTGAAHGTITVVMPSGPVEITSLRRDLATDGRHATVAFGTSFEDDAARRDFTINALFEDANGQIYDYVGGQADLERETLRFVGPASERIREDYLRILRLFRFWSKLGFQPTPETLAAVSGEREGLSRLSQERVSSELLRLFAGSNVHQALTAMVATGVWDAVLPELPWTDRQLPPQTHFGQWQGTAIASRGLAVLGGLCLNFDQFNEAELQSLATRLRLSKVESRKLAYFGPSVAQLRAAFADVASMLYFVDACEEAGGEGSFANFYAPVLATDAELGAALSRVQQAENQFGHRRLAKLPIDGKDLRQELQVPAGPVIGQYLADLRRAYYNGEWTTRVEGLALLRRQIAAAGP